MYKFLNKHIESDFIKDYSEQKPNALQFELNSIQVLLDCLSQITERLSENEIISIASNWQYFVHLPQPTHSSSITAR